MSDTTSDTTPHTMSADRFALVSAGHHFLLDVLPLRQPESHAALTTFLAAIDHIQPSTSDTDLVLLRCLAVVDRRTKQRIPSLVERYLANTASAAGSVDVFRHSIEDLLRYHSISDGTVQEAVAIIGTSYGDSTLNPRVIAERVGRRLSTLDVVFKRHLSCTVTEHLRMVRMQKAAVLLATTNKSIKEVWALVGYNHASNFDHDFKRQFGVSPRQMRGRSIRPVAQLHYGSNTGAPINGHALATHGRAPRVLIVDDDEATRFILGVFLQRENYAVTTVSSGSEGLQHVKTLSPDAILLDYRLGDMTGLGFLQTLRNELPDANPAVALFTADLDILDKCDEIHALNAIAVSKLCDLEQVRDLATYLSTKPVALVDDWMRMSAAGLGRTLAPAAGHA